MELQNNSFSTFMINFRIKSERFSGASYICAVILNFLLYIVKLIVCGIVLIITAPHLAASRTRQDYHSSWTLKIVYAILVVISLVMDIPLIVVTATFFTLAFGSFREVFSNVFMLIPFSIFAGLTYLCTKILTPLITTLFRDPLPEPEYVEDKEDYTYEEYPVEEEDELHFCQLFTLGEDMCLFIDHVEMCPDETAFIRVVGEESYTPLYKRKVRKNKNEQRYIIFNNTNYYLDDKKTQPIIPN